MTETRRYVVFTLEDRRYALPLEGVERVLRMVAVTPVHELPPTLLGVVNMQGEIVPVVNTRRYFHVRERAPGVDDQLIVTRTGGRALALVADRVVGVVEREARHVVAAEDVVPGAESLRGIAKLGDGMVLVHDLDQFQDATLARPARKGG